MLQAGAQFLLPASGRTCTVVRFLGEGSQGSVHEVAVGETGTRMALKWYFPGAIAEMQRPAIEELVERGAPDSRFLWPSEVVVLPGVDAFGYLMPLRPNDYVSLSDLLTGRVDVPFSVVCMLGMELADSFLSLHSQGLCYRDISFGNVFLHRSTGRPLICDTDNVGIDGGSTSVVLGTRRFMAPEIVRREAVPSTATDLYSLAVLLFYVLMVGHPLVGRRELEFQPWDDRAESVLFGREPLFVFDPDDRTNAPVPELHGSVLTNWALYPTHVRRLFETAFTTGLDDPTNGRVRESVWRAALARARDLLVRCPSCRKENFWNPDDVVACWNCASTIPTPMRFEVDGRPLVINGDTVLCRHHVALDYDFLTVVGRVAQHPQDPNRWGLKNETDRPWSVRLRSGEVAEVGAGRSVALQPGTVVRIDRAKVEIAW